MGVSHTYEVWDTRGRLAYVGIADDFMKRWAQHVRQSWWLGEIEVAYVTVIRYATRAGARLSEAAMINEQSPVYNTARESAAYRAYLEMTDGLGVISHHRYYADDLLAVRS